MAESGELQQNYSSVNTSKLRLAIFVLLPLALLAVILCAELHQDFSGRLLRHGALLVLGMMWGWLTSVFFKGPSRPVIFSAITAFTLIWGASIFWSYSFYDEIFRSAVTLNPASWLVPVNDHFQPLMYPVWWLQHNSFFGGSYVPVSTSMYIFAVIGITAAFRLALTLTNELGAYIALIASMIASIPLHNGDLWWWKGAGDAPVISLTFLFLWLAYLVFRGASANLSQICVATLLSGAAIFSSSSVTVIFIYGIPLLFVSRLRTKRFAICLGTSFVLTCAYWMTRTFLLDLELPRKSRNITDIPGAIAGVWIEFGFSNPLLVTVTALLGGIGAWTCIRYKGELRAFACIGVLLSLVGSIQLWGARDLALDTAKFLAGYHMYLPFVGCSILVGLGLAQVVRPFGTGRRVLVAVTSVYLALGAIAFSFPPASMFWEELPISTTLTSRQLFFSELRGLGEARVPDILTSTSIKYREWHFAPNQLVEATNEENASSWRETIRLSDLRNLAGASFTAVPCEGPSEQYSKPVEDFVKRYWGSKEPCVYANGE